MNHAIASLSIFIIWSLNFHFAALNLVVEIFSGPLL